tara:strand:+ start:19 stop:966 length:948 start_codon:yes stop_codon:yes gene_type:complete
MTRLKIIFFILTSLPIVVNGQFEIRLFPTCGDPYSIFENQTSYLPKVTSFERSRNLGITQISQVTFIKDSEESFRTERFTSIEFNDSGAIKNFYSMDSLWQNRSWFSKNRWKIILTKSTIVYSENGSIDTMTISILDNYPRRLKDNWLNHTYCNSDTRDETWVELSNRQFDEELSNYIYLPLENIQHGQILNLVKNDTIAFSRSSLHQASFRQSDTIHGKVEHAWTKPTLIFDLNGKLLREFPVPPDFQAHFNRHYYIDYIYNENGQLIKKEWVGYEFYKSEYFYFDENGLISSIWVEDKDNFTLKTAYIYKQKN